MHTLESRGPEDVRAPLCVSEQHASYTILYAQMPEIVPHLDTWQERRDRSVGYVPFELADVQMFAASGFDVVTPAALEHMAVLPIPFRSTASVVNVISFSGAQVPGLQSHDLSVYVLLNIWKNVPSSIRS